MASVTGPQDFKQAAHSALADQDLQLSLSRFTRNAMNQRAQSVADCPEFDDLRDQAVAIKEHALAYLDHYLEEFAQKAEQAGAKIHWCKTGPEACEAILAICKSKNAKIVTKGKSMVSEEIGLNHALEKAGIDPVETDLGEYIIQLAGETPSHIVAPVAHKSREEIERLFARHHTNRAPKGAENHDEALVDEVRMILRDQYFSAQIGITGANFLIAETGSTAIVTNEGNGDLTQSLAPCHIVITSIEKIVPLLSDAAILTRILTRSATGQEISAYVTYSTGPKRVEDADGPQDFHIVLLDNGRSRLLNSQFGEVLRCIKCGACMNHCPIYEAVGGHAYGSVYMGPIGAVLTPHFFGMRAHRDLPHASSFCGRCEEVCPMRIPLPKLLRFWREKIHTARQSPKTERFALGVWAFFTRRAWLYRAMINIILPFLSLLAPRNGRFRYLPFAHGWLKSRDLPVPARQSFMAQYQKKLRKQKASAPK